MLSSREGDDAEPQERGTEGPSSQAGDAPARITRLVAAIKAERAAGGDAAAAMSERDKVVALLRQFIAAREQERCQWQETMAATRKELDEARAAAQAAQTRHEQATAQQRRAMTDLELLHEHQRSIWQLDRRRLEITVAAHAAQERSRRTRGSRLAIAAALLLVGVAGFALLGDHAVAVGVTDAAGYTAASGSSR